jgi:biopolymer transport protein ExbD
MTPMIDVVFLLLVFFICASVGGTADHLLPAELNGTTASPQAEKPAEQAADWEHPAIQIRMEPGPTGPKILLDNQLLPDSEALTERLTLLAAADAESKIILNIQDEIQVQQFIHVYDLCQSLKFQNISFAVAARDEPK